MQARVPDGRGDVENHLPSGISLSCRSASHHPSQALLQQCAGTSHAGRPCRRGGGIHQDQSHPLLLPSPVGTFSGPNSSSFLLMRLPGLYCHHIKGERDRLNMATCPCQPHNHFSFTWKAQSTTVTSGDQMLRNSFWRECTPHKYLWKAQQRAIVTRGRRCSPACMLASPRA